MSLYKFSWVDFLSEFLAEVNRKFLDWSSRPKNINKKSKKKQLLKSENDHFGIIAFRHRDSLSAIKIQVSSRTLPLTITKHKLFHKLFQHTNFVCLSYKIIATLNYLYNFVGDIFRTVWIYYIYFHSIV